MTAIGILADATIKAASLMLLARGFEIKDIDCGVLAAAVKDTLKANIPTILDEWEAASNAALSEGWLRMMMNTQAHELAIKSLERLEGY